MVRLANGIPSIWAVGGGTGANVDEGWTGGQQDAGAGDGCQDAAVGTGAGGQDVDGKKPFIDEVHESVCWGIAAAVAIGGPWFGALVVIANGGGAKKVEVGSCGAEDAFVGQP